VERNVTVAIPHNPATLWVAGISSTDVKHFKDKPFTVQCTVLVLYQITHIH
jgi:hypothetical protein